MNIEDLTPTKQKDNIKSSVTVDKIEMEMEDITVCDKIDDIDLLESTIPGFESDSILTEKQKQENSLKETMDMNDTDKIGIDLPPNESS